MSTEIVEIDYEHEALDEKALRSVTSAEIMLQHQIARQLPRRPTDCRRQAMELATENEEVAEECVYSMKRGNKMIEGPSIRFAEIFGACWGNNRVLARVIDAGDYFVTAQGIFQDLESNRVVVKEEQRRIVDKDGKRYNIDMIGVTANAAASIALRNATLRGIPKPHWLPSFLAARALIVGDARSMPYKRQKAIAVLGKMGATPEEILRLLGVKSEGDIDGDALLRLRGIITSIREDQTSIEFVLRDVRGGKPKTDLGEKYRNGKTSRATAEATPEDQGVSESGETAPQSDAKAETAPATSGTELTEDETLFLDDFSKQLAKAMSREEVMAAIEEYDAAIKTFSKAIGERVDAMCQERLDQVAKPKAEKRKSAAAAKL